MKVVALVLVAGAAGVGIWAGSLGGRPAPAPPDPTDVAAADFLPATDSATTQPSEDRGATVFEARCASCHTIGGGERTGPDLAAAAMRRDPTWVSAMILAPDSMFRADSVARWILDVHDIPEDAAQDNPELRALADFFATIAAVPRRLRAPSPE